MTLMEKLVRLLGGSLRWSLIWLHLRPVKRSGRRSITRYSFLGGAAWPH